MKIFDAKDLDRASIARHLERSLSRTCPGTYGSGVALRRGLEEPLKRIAPRKGRICGGSAVRLPLIDSSRVSSSNH